MAYTLFDKYGRVVTHYDLQDKIRWCKTGEGYEHSFVRRFGALWGIVINPQKSQDARAPDLFNFTDNSISDLKVQRTPFFQAQDLFGFDPQYAVVFNVKDREHYEQRYPNLSRVYFWVNWEACRFKSDGGEEIEVVPMYGMWSILFQELLSILDVSKIYTYSQRVDDTSGNAKDSYVVSLLDSRFVLLTDPQEEFVPVDPHVCECWMCVQTAYNTMHRKVCP